MSVVQKIKQLKSANELNFTKLVEFKANARPLPELSLRQTSKDKNKEVHRNFRKGMYDLADWICGCEVSNAFYCFVCLLFSKDSSDSLWCKSGVKDLKHLKEKMKKHASSAEHMKCSVNFATVGSVDIRTQLNNAYRKSLTDFNENVSKNRYILNKIVDCIKFCGAFELALRGHDETALSDNPGVFRGLIDFVVELDPIFQEHMEKATVFKGTSKSIQNDLLDSMLAVVQEQIKQEIKSAKYVAVQVDETTDSSTKTQMVFIIRYILSGVVHERFVKFVNPLGTTASHLTDVILHELENVDIHKFPEKLIAQTYDGASTMSGKLGGVQKKIKEHYPAANFIHCYAHQFNLILQKAAGKDKSVKVFFANLHGFSTFFSRSPKRTAVLDEFVKARLPRAAPTRWHFNVRCVETVFVYSVDILLCLEKIIEIEEDSKTINQAIGLKGFLQNEDFIFWLNFFHLVMPHCEILFKELQKRSIDILSVKNYIDSFKSSIQAVRDKLLNDLSSEMPTTSSNTTKRSRKNEDSKRRVALEVCDIIISEMHHRFSFSDHLVISQLFYSDQFENYKNNFPDNILNLVKKDYPSINFLKLKTELQVIYDRPDFRGSSGAVSLLQLFMNNNLSETFSETVNLLTLLCTLPMTTVESERCFSTLNRIKTFLRNTMGQDRLSALAMLSIEKSFVKGICDFNERVIQHFSTAKERRMDLQFKTI